MTELIEQQKDYLTVLWNTTETQDIIDLSNFNGSFFENVMSNNKMNMTEVVLKELDYILNGPIPRNFVINFRGLIGRKTGIFKSSFALQLAFMLDPTFNIAERVAFTANELNELIKQHSTRKQIFFLDEQTHDLKISATMRLANIIESCRERQLCFILVGVDEMRIKLSDYYFERIGESNDKLLPNKTIFYAIKKTFDNKDVYRGYFKWNVTPLTNKLWVKIWDEYMIKKSIYEKQATDQMLTGFPIAKIGSQIILNDNFDQCIRINTKGKEIIDIGILRNLVYKLFPDVTSDERTMLVNEVKTLWQNNNINKQEDSINF